MSGALVCSSHAGRSRGPRPGLTPEIRARIASAVSAGASLSAALAEAGLAHSTVGDWLRRAEIDPDDPAGEPFRALRDDVEAARGRAIVGHAATIARAARDDWRASAWLLARLDPQTYGTPAERAERPSLPAGASTAEIVDLFGAGG